MVEKRREREPCISGSRYILWRKFLNKRLDRNKDCLSNICKPYMDNGQCYFSEKNRRLGIVCRECM